MVIRITQKYYFKNMKTKLLEKEIKYEGFQLAPHWIYKNFKIQGDSTVAFIGECDVKLDEMSYFEKKLSELFPDVSVEMERSENISGFANNDVPLPLVKGFA